MIKDNSTESAYNRGKKYIDYRMGLIGSVMMAIMVFCVNYFKSYEVLGATTASLKQGVYTLLFGGFFMRGCENLAVKIKKKNLALLLAVLIPSVVAISLTFAVHSMRGTPHPWESTLPTAILVFPASFIWGRRKRTMAGHSLEDEEKRVTGS